MIGNERLIFLLSLANNIQLTYGGVKLGTFDGRPNQWLVASFVIPEREMLVLKTARGSKEARIIPDKLDYTYISLSDIDSSELFLSQFKALLTNE